MDSRWFKGDPAQAPEAHAAPAPRPLACAPDIGGVGGQFYDPNTRCFDPPCRGAAPKSPALSLRKPARRVSSTKTHDILKSSHVLCSSRASSKQVWKISACFQRLLGELYIETFHLFAPRRSASLCFQDSVFFRDGRTMSRNAWQLLAAIGSSGFTSVAYISWRDTLVSARSTTTRSSRPSSGRQSNLQTLDTHTASRNNNIKRNVRQRSVCDMFKIGDSPVGVGASPLGYSSASNPSTWHLRMQRSGSLSHSLLPPRSRNETSLRQSSR